MLTITSGNLLNADVEALVNTVNCVGVMGKGIALQFRQAFPDNYKAYERACRAHLVEPGRMFVFDRHSFVGPKYIINFPTKRHWKGKSRIGDIRSGLEDLTSIVRQLGIQSIAVPPLGCGNGGLEWRSVLELIVDAFKGLPDVEVQLFAPVGTPSASHMPVATQKPKMTRGRALLILLLERYGAAAGYRRTMLEVQKLAYLLQEAGEKLRLKFTKYFLGPYAENLHHVLQHIEGHYVRGYGDRTNRAELTLLPGAVEAAEAFLANDHEAIARIALVSDLIHGFESPYGMELLATVLWIARENPESRGNFEVLLSDFRRWNVRKSEVFKSEHIRKAWSRLKDQGWLDGPPPITSSTRLLRSA